MTPHDFAAITLEYWRASGPRTEVRRDALLQSYIEAYYGLKSTWKPEIVSLSESATLMLRQRTRIDELQYS